jgi:hypothetical protein
MLALATTLFSSPTAVPSTFSLLHFPRSLYRYQQLSFSHPARLTFRSRAHIAQHLLNYVNRDSSYAELKRNCQTFASDLCAFVAGKKKVAPFHPVSRIEYTNRTYFFLYDSHMYDKSS